MAKRQKSDGYTSQLTQREILRLFRLGRYWVDPEAGLVYTGHHNNGSRTADQPLRFDNDSRGRNRRFVRICCRPKRIKIAVAKLVWLWVTRRVIPRGFEIHHKDEDDSNDNWWNLICIYKLDHEKFHQQNPAAPF